MNLKKFQKLDFVLTLIYLFQRSLMVAWSSSVLYVSLLCFSNIALHSDKSGPVRKIVEGKFVTTKLVTILIAL